MTNLLITLRCSAVLGCDRRHWSYIGDDDRERWGGVDGSAQQPAAHTLKRRRWHQAAHTLSAQRCCWYYNCCARSRVRACMHADVELRTQNWYDHFSIRFKLVYSVMTFPSYAIFRVEFKIVKSDHMYTWTYHADVCELGTVDGSQSLVWSFTICVWCRHVTSAETQLPNYICAKIYCSQTALRYNIIIIPIYVCWNCMWCVCTNICRCTNYVRLAKSF